MPEGRESLEHEGDGDSNRVGTFETVLKVLKRVLGELETKEELKESR